MIKLENINLHYGSSQILHNINMEIQEGKITTLMGSNGVGKTSLLKMLTGIHNPSSGDYFYQNINMNNEKSHNLAKKGIGYVPQGRFIFPLLSVRENLEIGFGCLKLQDHFIPEEIFDLFPILKKMIDRRGGDLSGGQQQQLAIARALITKPKVLLMDEPTEGIQPNIVLDIENAINLIIKETGIGVLLVEQHLHFVRQANRYYAMQRGGIVASGNTSELSQSVIDKFLSV